MEHIYSDKITPLEQRMLLQIARDSIAFGLRNKKPVVIDPDQFPIDLSRVQACFVTLRINSDLRGCIGTLSPEQTLVQAVSENAFSAAFNDPRFPPLKEAEFANITISISVLGVPEPIKFKDEEDLVSQIRPGIDGLIFQDGGFKGTFLPAVWEQISDPRTFLNELKRKAGFSSTHWSSTVKVSRYEAQSFSENA